MATRRGKVVDTITDPKTGISANIRFESKHKLFYAEFHGQEYLNANFGVVYDALEKAILAAGRLDWIPVIRLYNNNPHHIYRGVEISVSLVLDRLYVAERPDKKYVYRNWDSDLDFEGWEFRWNREHGGEFNPPCRLFSGLRYSFSDEVEGLFLPYDEDTYEQYRKLLTVLGVFSVKVDGLLKYDLDREEFKEQGRKWLVDQMESAVSQIQESEYYERRMNARRELTPQELKTLDTLYVEDEYLRFFENEDIDACHELLKMGYIHSDEDKPRSYCISTEGKILMEELRAKKTDI